MSRYNYAMKINEPNTAKAVGRSLSISTKMSVEISTYVKGKNIEKAIKMLEDVASKKKPLPLKRFKHDVAHHRGVGPSRFPVKASEEIIKVIKNAQANAQSKGLNVSNLIIKHICAQQAARNFHPGRLRGRKVKRTHVEIIVEEVKEAVKKEKKTLIKENKKTEIVKKDNQKIIKKDNKESKDLEKKDSSSDKNNN
jgi:large subunit ribosomal protein L22